MRRLLLLVFIPALALVAIVAWPRESGTRPALAVGETCAPALPHAAGTVVKTINTADGVRSYRLHVPASYTGSEPVPLVLGFHGANSNAFEQEVYSGLSTKSDAEGFIVAYPDAKPSSVAHWNAWQLGSPEPNEVAFVSSLITSLASTLCLDQSRVYSTGISNGAMMSVRLACSLSGRIAAIGPVAGSYYPPMSLGLNASENCPDTAITPVIAFHGTADATVPYNGGVGSGGGLNYRLPQDDDTPAEDVLADWAAHNACAGARVETQIDTEVRLIEYGACPGGALTQLYAVDGGGHTWPGSFDVPSLGYVTQQIDATDLIWAFFTNYTLPDADADLIPDSVDSCPADADFSQTNTDRNFIDQTPPSTQDDKTWPNSDLVGDACDVDDDNDGRSDAEEIGGVGCGGAITDPLVRDTDGDRALDGPECTLTTDPTSAASEPSAAACGSNLDADGDRLSDRAEVCGYGTNPASMDSDADMAVDGARDGCEAASLNGDRTVNSGDQLLLVLEILREPSPSLRLVSMDINKDGAVNVGDQLLVALFLAVPGQCP